MPGGTSSEARLRPEQALTPHPVSGRARLLYRWARFIVRSARAGWFDFSARGVRAMAGLIVLWVQESRGPDLVECNICGWRGRQFYPLVGPGYDERDTTCPGCLAQDRHRSLVAVLLSCTPAFTPGHRVVEVAPMRFTDELFQAAPHVDYVSFDLARRAMEQGDITAMRYSDRSVDVFICFHVLEHLPREADALREVYRVLRPGAVAVVQVPVDWNLATTVEYGCPDPRDVGHVRRNGRDFPDRLRSSGFDVVEVNVSDLATEGERQRYGLGAEPIYLLRRAPEAEPGAVASP